MPGFSLAISGIGFAASGRGSLLLGGIPALVCPGMPQPRPRGLTAEILFPGHSAKGQPAEIVTQWPEGVKKA
jgi:hypothetical protein